MTRRTLLAFTLLLLPGICCAAPDKLAPGRYVEKLTVGDLEREYIVKVPAGSDSKKPLPLVVFMHGRGGTMQMAERAYGWSELAEKENFVVVFPQATVDRGGQASWNSGYNAGAMGGRTTDDVAFLKAAIAATKKQVSIDTKRIFVAGHSSGGMMSYKFGGEASELVAAIGVGSGSAGSKALGKLVRVPEPKSPVSLIHFHGKADEIVPYDASTKKARYDFMGFMPAPDSVSYWAKADGCNKTAKRETSAGGNVIKETYSGGKNGTEAVLYTIVDGGHMWPGMRRVRLGETPNQDVNATTLMWEFFKAHPKK